MNIVMITTAGRPDLLKQSLRSLRDNAADFKAHHLTIVIDRYLEANRFADAQTLIINTSQQGASASRNIGAGSVPRHRRQDHVLFLDDDVYMCPGYDAKIEELLRSLPHDICSGSSHPYNHGEPRGDYSIPLVISSVCMAMKWSIFDEAGPWQEPGGAGASEDYALCMKAKDLGYGFAVTSPEVVLHCGLTSSTGKEIVGADLVRQRNSELEIHHGISGKVLYA